MSGIHKSSYFIKELTQEEEQVLIGSLLGDSTLRRETFTTWGSFRHSLKQRNYGMWKYEQLKRICGTWREYTTYNKKVKKYYNGIAFNIRNHVVLNYYHNIFYGDGKKRITPEIVEKLTPLGLAIWFMDDGTKKERKSDNNKGSYCIATNCFTKEDLESIIPILERKFGFKSNLHFDKKQPVLYISSKTSEIFTKLIEPFIHSELRYKLHENLLDDSYKYAIRKKEVYQFDVNMNYLNSYESATYAAKINKFLQGHISSCCRGERYTHKGFKWMYGEDYKKLQNK